MTRTAAVDPATDVRRSAAQKATEQQLATALQRVTAADNAVADAVTARDALHSLMRDDVAKVTPGDFQHADAVVTHAEFTAIAARDAVPTAQEAIRAADLIEALNAAHRFTKSEAAVGWREADQLAKDQRIRADALKAAFNAGVRTVGENLRRLGAQHSHGNGVDGYIAHGVGTSYVSVIGFSLDQVDWTVS